MIEKIMSSTNLNQKEAALYLACLKTGQSTITKLASLAGLNRITAYSIAEKLVQKGFFTTNRKGKITFFDATDPKQIYEGLKERTQHLKTLLPDLKRLHGKAEHPVVRYFEGVEAIKTLYLDSLTSQTEILNYANSREIRSFWPEYDREYVKERARRKIYLRGFAPDDNYGKDVFQNNDKYHREIRLLPADKAIFYNETNIYDDKISMVSLKGKPLGIIIQNQELVDTQRSIFELLWELTG
jgi:sugar-specific transcriptional regulator TrmB